MDSLEKAQAERAAAQAEADVATAKVARLEASLAALQATLEEATAKRTAAEQQAAACTERLNLANRLVNGLASENNRWGNEVEALHAREKRLIGDTLLAAGFVSYVGAFNAAYRRMLWESAWIADIKARGIPVSEGSDPLDQLTGEPPGVACTRASQGAVVCAREGHVCPPLTLRHPPTHSLARSQMKAARRRC